MLDQKNPHPRDHRIRFFEEDHRYEVDGVTYTSVTTVIKQFFPQFDPDAAIRKMGRSHPFYGRPPEEIKAEWERRGEESRNKGTEMHRQIEEFLNTGELGACQEFQRFHQIYQKSGRGEPYRTEWVIFDEETHIAGTIDYVYKVGDAFFMTDWKRSKQIKKENRWEKATGPISHLPACNYSEYCLQQNIYRLILQKNYDIEIRKMALAQFYGDHFEAHQVPTMEAEAQEVMHMASREKSD